MQETTSCTQAKECNTDLLMSKMDDLEQFLSEQVKDLLETTRVVRVDSTPTTGGNKEDSIEYPIPPLYEEMFARIFRLRVITENLRNVIREIKL